MSCYWYHMNYNLVMNQSLLNLVHNTLLTHLHTLPTLPPKIASHRLWRSGANKSCCGCCILRWVPPLSAIPLSPLPLSHYSLSPIPYSLSPYPRSPVPLFPVLIECITSFCNRLLHTCHSHLPSHNIPMLHYLVISLWYRCYQVHPSSSMKHFDVIIKALSQLPPSPPVLFHLFISDILVRFGKCLRRITTIGTGSTGHWVVFDAEFVVFVRNVIYHDFKKMWTIFVVKKLCCNLFMDRWSPPPPSCPFLSSNLYSLPLTNSWHHHIITSILITLPISRVLTRYSDDCPRHWWPPCLYDSYMYPLLPTITHCWLRLLLNIHIHPKVPN